MKKPTWVTIVGILGIVFGVSGLFASAQTAAMPIMMDMQKQMMETMQKSMEAKSSDAAQFELLRKTIEGFTPDFPKWYSSASIFVGIFSLLVNGLYIYSAILLLQLKGAAIRLFYIALGLSIALAISRTGMSMAAFSMMSAAIAVGGMISVVIDIVLLVVVVTSDKSIFGMSESVNAN